MVMGQREGMMQALSLLTAAGVVLVLHGCGSPTREPTDGRPAELTYIKASNADAEDQFGSSIALSADGSTLAVGAYLEASAATGVGGDESDNSVPEAGAVYVFTRTGGAWSQQAYLKASTAARNHFGTSVALSADGSTLAVGAEFELSAHGAVYVFTRTGGAWSQQAYLRPDYLDPALGDSFGFSVALSADGSTIAVGAPVESSAATGIDGDPTDNSSSSSGAAYVFTLAGMTWSQQAYVKAFNTATRDFFGTSVALSADGSSLAIGGSHDTAGVVHAFSRIATQWSQSGYLQPSDSMVRDAFGSSVALTANGATLAVGATAANRGPGAAYVFTRSGTTWIQDTVLTAPKTGPSTGLGASVGLSVSGATLAVGANGESSKTTGIDGEEGNALAPGSGAVYTFTRDAATWNRQAYVKASNTGILDGFGTSVALSSDGSTLAVGAPHESSTARGIGGNQRSRSAPSSGAVYVLPWPQ